MKIIVTGSTGFLGRHLMPLLRDKYGKTAVTGLSSKDYDLMDPIAVVKMFREHKPEYLIHLAAYSGGIGANKEFPADFYYQNTLLTTLVFEQAAKSKLKKMIYTMGGCSYPASAPSPIDENQMWNGYPQEESAGYSMAKKMGIVASNVYRKQHGLDSTILIPGNMYGEFDNYRNAESHVIPAMIRRFHEAKLNKTEKLVMWGTGKPQRDFVYAGDVAQCMLHFLDHPQTTPVNLSSGTRTSIKELASLVGEIVGYSGIIEWDETKPDGQMVKIFDTKRMKALGLDCPTPLNKGIDRTYEWFAKNYQNRSDGLRL